MTLPIYYNVPIKITIHNNNQKNVNPEESQNILVASLKIMNYKQNYQETNVYDFNKKKIAVILICYKVANQKMIVPENKGVVTVSSLLAHFDSHHGYQGFIEIKVGSHSVFTPEVDVVAG